jgi:hypothetical protein
MNRNLSAIDSPSLSLDLHNPLDNLAARALHLPVLKRLSSFG